MKANTSSYFMQGMRVGIPISLGYMAVAFALGITCKSTGLSALQSGIMSAGMLASAGEYAAVSLIGSCAGALEMIFTIIVVNLRYLLMGCALSQKIKEDTPVYHRFLLSYCITDEIFGVCSSVSGKLKPSYAYGCTLISAIGWVSGTVIGVLAGSLMPAWLVNALSVALYGMFLAVIIPAAKTDRFIAGVVIISMFTSFLFGVLPLIREISGGFRIIILTILIAGIAALIRPIDPDTGKPLPSAERSRV